MKQKTKVVRKGKIVMRCGVIVSTIKDGSIERVTDHQAVWKVNPIQRVFQKRTQ